jgi:hypothetical protein
LRVRGHRARRRLCRQVYGRRALAYFGYPRADEHDAERAVRTGLALVEAVSGLDSAAGVPLQVRIGVATGLVVVGDLIGQGAAQEQAVVGETPNLAARLQALAEPGTVVIAPGTRRLTSGLFDYEDLGAVEIKGLAAPVIASRVLRESGAESRLGRREGATLAALVASDRPLPEDITAEIVERTDGIPLFVEELTKAVLETEARGAEGKKTLTTAPLSAPTVPATLHASRIARLDRLGPSAKETAQVAAVIGREFSYELLAPVAQKSEPDLRAALDRLGDAGLVFCRGAPPQATFLFKHALVRDAAYSSLLRSRRQQLNADIATVLEDRFPEKHGRAQT